MIVNLSLQPTWGAISREGLAQYSMTCDTLGFFSRSVEDLELLAGVFKLADDEPISPVAFSLKGANVALCKSPVWSKAGPGTQKAFEKAQELLKKSGATITELDLPQEFTRITEWHAMVLAGEGRTSFLGRQSPSLLHFCCNADGNLQNTSLGRRS